jgi:hypothetical protein
MSDTAATSIEIIQAVSFKTGKVKSLPVSYEAWIVGGGSPLVMMPVIKASGLAFKLVKVEALGSYKVYAYDHVKKVKGVEVMTPINDFVVLKVNEQGDFSADNDKIDRKLANAIGKKIYESLTALPLVMMIEVGMIPEDNGLVKATLSSALGSLLGVENRNLMTREDRDNLAAAMLDVAVNVPALRYDTPKAWIKVLEDSRLAELRLTQYLETEERKALVAAEVTNDSF